MDAVTDSYQMRWEYGYVILSMDLGEMYLLIHALTLAVEIRAWMSKNIPYFYVIMWLLIYALNPMVTRLISCR